MKKLHLTDIIVILALILLGVWFVRSIPHTASAKNSVIQAETTSQLSPAVIDGQPITTAEQASTPTAPSVSAMSATVADDTEPTSTTKTPQKPAPVSENANYNTQSNTTAPADSSNNTNTTSTTVGF